MRRQGLYAVIAFVLSVSLCSVGAAQTQTAGVGRTAATAPSVPRVIVKLRPSFATQLETALPLTTMSLSPGASGNAAIDRFMSQHGARRISPLYANLVRTKKQRHVSEAQIVQEVRNRFGRRAARVRPSLAPPEIARTYALELNDPAAAPLSMIVDRLNRDPNVEWAEPDHVAVAIYTPNDPYFSSYGSWGQGYDDLWGTKTIGAPAAWDTTRGDGVVVAVVDTGIDLGHPDIVANLWINPREIAGNGIDDDGNGYVDDVYGWDFIGSNYAHPTQGNNPTDHYGHGSHVAGTIAATGDNATGIVGVAWHAQVMAVKGLDDYGYGLDSTLGPAITYAANNGADIISNSWGGPGNSQTIADAVSYAYSLGAVVVAAAGNNHDDARNYYPANLWNVITVGATSPPSNGNEYLAYFSNWGSKIDVTAPGVDILSLRAAGTSMGRPVDAYYTRADGTSMAAPHVSGAAALILAQHPDYSNEDVRQVLRVSAADLGSAGFDLDYGYGRINAAGATTVANPLAAKISSPADGTHVKSPTTISGVAQGAAFSSYTLEYGAGRLPASWTTIQSGVAPVSGTLGTFDPSSLPDGVYALRLTAYNAAGQPFVDRIEVIVDYVAITSPVAPPVPSVAEEYKPGAPVSIVGTAVGTGFQNFTVDWAEGINPSSGWSTAGVALNGGGTSPITNDVLATWDTSAVTLADYYTVRLTVNNSTYTSQAYTVVYLEPDLISTGWPKWLDQAPYFNSGFVPALNADGSVRLTLMNPAYGNTTLPAKYWRFAPDGSSQYTAIISNGDYMQPAAAEFAGAAGQESIMTENNAVAVFHPDNTLTRLSPLANIGLGWQLPVVEDLNGDSQFELVALGRGPTQGQAYVFAWRRDGQQLNSNFPIPLADQNSDLWYALGARVLVGDVDGDGQREIIAQEGTTASTFTVRMFASDGTPKANWPNPSFSGYARSMVLADLDHNGSLEIILIVSANSQGSIHVLQPDGTERPGWPVLVGGVNLAQVAVGDLNRDGQEEIVVVSSSIYAFNADGTTFGTVFPIRPPDGYQNYGGLALADVDGDGRPEILTVQNHMKYATNPLLPELVVPPPTIAANGAIVQDSPRIELSGADSYPPVGYCEPMLLALHSDGTIGKSWRLLGANGNQPDYLAAISVGDFNQDGKTDIGVVHFVVSGGGLSGYLSEGAATVLTTGSAFVAANNDWPLPYRNSRNTALLRRDQVPPSVAISSPTGGIVSATTVVSIAAADNDEVTRVEFYVDGSLRGTTVTAPFTVSWDTTAESNGVHSLSAKAYDPSGNVGTSSVVQVTVSQAPAASASPASITFADQVLNTAAPAQTVTVTNTGYSNLHVSSVTVSGDQDFSVSGNNCLGAAIAPNGTCSIQVVFSPKSLGLGSASLTIASDASNSPLSVPLSGNGVDSAPTFSPASVAFGNVFVGKASGNKTVKLTANGPAALALSGISVGNGFTQTNNCPASLNKGSSCNITVAFRPTTAGAYAGSLTVADNGLGSPQTVPLTGNGLDFSISASPSSVSVAAGGKATYTVTVSALGGSYSTNVALTCSGLPTGAKCLFSPSGVSPGSGSASSTLTISTTSGASGTPPGSYAVTIKGTANNTTHLTTVTLVVN